jgi:hypothetical protein
MDTGYPVRPETEYPIGFSVENFKDFQNTVYMKYTKKSDVSKVSFFKI